MVETESEERPRGSREHMGCKKNTDADVCKAIFPAVGGNVIKMTHTNDFLTTKCAHTYTNWRFLCSCFHVHTVILSVINPLEPQTSLNFTAQNRELFIPPFKTTALLWLLYFKNQRIYSKVLLFPSPLQQSYRSRLVTLSRTGSIIYPWSGWKQQSWICVSTCCTAINSLTFSSHFHHESQTHSYIKTTYEENHSCIILFAIPVIGLV